MCITYLDNIIVYSPDFESHLEHLCEIFKRLCEKGIKLKAQKCERFKNKVKYLGLIVSEEDSIKDSWLCAQNYWSLELLQEIC